MMCSPQIGPYSWLPSFLHYETLFCLKIQSCIHLFMSDLPWCPCVTSMTSMIQVHDLVVFHYCVTFPLSCSSLVNFTPGWILPHCLALLPGLPWVPWYYIAWFLFICKLLFWNTYFKTLTIIPLHLYSPFHSPFLFHIIFSFTICFPMKYLSL